MSSYSVLLHVQSFVETPEDEKATVIKSVMDPEERRRLGTVVRNDRIQMDVNIKFSDLGKPKDATEMMEMQIPLRFNNKSEFLAVFRQAIARFERHETTAQHRRKAGFGLEIGFSRYNFSADLPEYVLEAITEIFVKNKNYRHKITKKLSVFTPEQKEKLEENLKYKDQLERSYKAKNNYNSRHLRQFFVGGAALYLASFIVSAVWLPYVIVGTLGVFSAKIALDRVINRKAQHYHDNKDSIAKNTPDYAAFESGCSQSYSAIFKHFRHAIAFLAGKQLNWLKQNHIVLVLQRNTPSESERKAQCEERLAAILGRKPEDTNKNNNVNQEEAAKPVEATPIVVTTTIAAGNKPDEAPTTRRYPKRQCRK